MGRKYDDAAIDKLVTDLDDIIRMMRNNPDYTDAYSRAIEKAGVEAGLWPLEACDVYKGEDE